MNWGKQASTWLERVILHRFRRKPLTKEVTETEVVRGKTGPLTASQALELAVKMARKVDPSFKLKRVACESIDHQGRGWTWEFLFDFPGRIAAGDITIAPCDSFGETGRQPVCLSATLRSKAAEGIVQLLDQFKNDPATLSYLSNVYQLRDDGRLYLPLKFRDSPQVVEKLTAQGVDFFSRTSNLSLSTRILPDGEIAWITSIDDREYRIPFLG